MTGNTSKQPRIVVVGAGFGGMNAARALAGVDAEVLLIDRQNYHLFQPLLYQVATAGLEPEQIAKPVRSILRQQQNLTFRMGEVRSVELGSRRLETSFGSVPYDYLILSVGAESNDYGIEGIRSHAFSLKGLDDGIAIRNHVLRCFEQAAVEPDEARRKGLLTFVIVGGGPTGVETAGALSELFQLVLAKDYPRLSLADARVVLLEAQSEILAGFPSDLAEAAERELRSKGVRVRLDTTFEAYDGETVKLAGGESIDAATVVWSAGVQAASLVRGLDADHRHAGRVLVDPFLRLPTHPEVYVIGDAAYVENTDEPLPMMAPVAIQMAEVATNNIQNTLAGHPLEQFVYKDPGRLATIGRNAAVAAVGGIKARGFLAWLLWLVVHLIQLIGFRNRLIVLINWAWDYFFYDRAVRLITGGGQSTQES